MPSEEGGLRGLALPLFKCQLTPGIPVPLLDVAHAGDDSARLASSWGRRC